MVHDFIQPPVPSNGLSLFKVVILLWRELHPACGCPGLKLLHQVLPRLYGFKLLFRLFSCRGFLPASGPAFIAQQTEESPLCQLLPPRDVIYMCQLLLEHSVWLCNCVQVGGVYDVLSVLREVLRGFFDVLKVWPDLQAVKAHPELSVGYGTDCPPSTVTDIHVSQLHAQMSILSAADNVPFSQLQQGKSKHRLEALPPVRSMPAHQVLCNRSQLV
jgi:hypothetical protein